MSDSEHSFFCWANPLIFYSRDCPHGKASNQLKVHLSNLSTGSELFKSARQVYVIVFHIYIQQKISEEVFKSTESSSGEEFGE